MRIDAFAQVQQLYNNNSTKQLKKETTKSFSDQLQISSMGKDIQTAKQAVAGAADVREDLVSRVKSQLNDGTYSVDTDSFAEKLFARYSAF